MSKFKKEIQLELAKYIYENSNIYKEIENLIKEGIKDSIDYSTDDAHHQKPSGIPADTIIKMKQPEFDPIDNFTILRRKVYNILGKSTLRTRRAMKEDAIRGTMVTKKLVSTTIKIKIENRSPLLTYLRSGKLGEMASKTIEAVNRERNFIMMLTRDTTSATNPFVKEYLNRLENIINGVSRKIGRIPIRNVLRASSELIGKDFISKNII